jgi:hypothetical protein
LGECVCVSIGLESNKVVMMTVHDHIEGSFGVGANEKRVESSQVGKSEGWGARGRIMGRVGAIPFLVLASPFGV